MLDDLQIIDNVLNGEENDYAILIRRHESRVRAVCRVYLPDTEEADEAAQEIFLRAYKNLRSFRRTALFTTWLHRIAINHCLDLRRKRKRRDEISLDSLIEIGAEGALPHFNEPVEKAFETGEFARALLSRVSPVDREVLVLREISGQSYEEIAENLHITLDAVKSRLKRARQSMVTQARHLLKSQNV